MMLLCMDMMAQIDINDGNWEIVLEDDFRNNAWDYGNWLISNPYGHYKAFIPEWPSGVSRGSAEHQVYQRENCQFSNNGSLRFVSVYEGGDNMLPLQCGDYDIPLGKTCDANHQTLFYTSAKIETDVKYLYGYFEVECSLPIHDGSFPAFWLYGAGANHYNEIDIFEYSKGSSYDDYYKQFTCGIYSDNDHPAPPDSLFSTISHARLKPILPSSSDDLTHPHVFSCEWMPDRITWYVDGIAVNEFTDYRFIPHHPMALKLNYAINNYAMLKIGENQYIPNWFDGDEMTVYHLKVCRLKTDCDTDIVISDAQDLADFQPSVKKSISIVPSASFVAPADTNVSMWASESIVIDKGFALPQGAQITLQTQLCPE